MANPLAGGSVNCTSPVGHGDTTSCAAAPNAGYSLSGISGCGDAASSASPYTTGAVTAACTVTVAFVALPAPAALSIPALDNVRLTLLMVMMMLAGFVNVQRSRRR